MGKPGWAFPLPLMDREGQPGFGTDPGIRIHAGLGVDQFGAAFGADHVIAEIG